MMGTLFGIIRQRCPRCRRAPVFGRFMAMHQRCAVCNLQFEREPGYFLGAMYASYGFGLVTTAYWLPMLLMGVSPLWVIGLPTVQLILQVPISFRYSRMLWLYLDHGFDPEPRAGPGLNPK